MKSYLIMIWDSDRIYYYDRIFHSNLHIPPSIVLFLSLELNAIVGLFCILLNIRFHKLVYTYIK